MNELSYFFVLFIKWMFCLKSNTPKICSVILSKYSLRFSKKAICLFAKYVLIVAGYNIIGSLLRGCRQIPANSTCSVFHAAPTFYPTPPPYQPRESCQIFTCQAYQSCGLHNKILYFHKLEVAFFSYYQVESIFQPGRH